MGRFDPTTLKVCYEAGPTGYGLARLAASMGIDWQVVAPSLSRPRRVTGSRPTSVMPAASCGWHGPGSDPDPYPDRT